jgi:DNA-binding MarR family transcriptional regulator
VLIVLRLFRTLERVDTGLTPQQYRILKLAGAGGERSARLAERLAVAKPTLTATADGLVAAGLACREAEAGDRRVVRLRLTEAGAAALARAEAAYADWLTRVLSHSADPAGALRGLHLLSDALDDVRRSRSSGPGQQTGVAADEHAEEPVLKLTADGDPGRARAQRRPAGAGRR